MECAKLMATFNELKWAMNSFLFPACYHIFADLNLKCCFACLPLSFCDACTYYVLSHWDTRTSSEDLRRRRGRCLSQLSPLEKWSLVKDALFGHRAVWIPQMMWTLSKLCGTLHGTPRAWCWDIWMPQKTALGSPRNSRKWPFWAKIWRTFENMNILHPWKLVLILMSIEW